MGAAAVIPVLGAMGGAGVCQVPGDFVVYHGTSLEKWSESVAFDTQLYLTDELGIAETYAAEWVAEGMTPAVISFTLSDLIQAGLELQPNWETVEQAEQGLWGERQMRTWLDTLAANATFCVHGRIDAVKHLGSVANLGAAPTYTA